MSNNKIKSEGLNIKSHRLSKKEIEDNFSDTLLSNPLTAPKTVFNEAIPRARLTIETIFVILKRKLLCDEKNSLLKTRKTNFILEI